MPYMQDIKTLTGLPIEEAIAKLDEELPASAYKAVPGGADLTDIDPNHMRRVFNEVFGLAGYGWGYRYNPDHVYTRVEERSGKRTRTVVVAVVKQLELWYRVVVDGEIHTGTIPATGASENSSDAYALKGALTSAIGNAASNIGFQLSVYLGERSHKTVGRAPKRKTAPKPAPKRKPAPAPAAAASATAPAAVDDLDDLDEAPASATASYGDYIIPFGKNKGKKLSDVSRRAVEWYANEMDPSTSVGEELQEAAKAFLEEVD